MVTFARGKDIRGGLECVEATSIHRLHDSGRALLKYTMHTDVYTCTYGEVRAFADKNNISMKTLQKTKLLGNAYREQLPGVAVTMHLMCLAHALQQGNSLQNDIHAITPQHHCIVVRTLDRQEGPTVVS